MKNELIDCYELGKRAAWDNQSIDNCPRYRKQNKVSSWLKGFLDGQREKNLKDLQGNINREGLAKLKLIMIQVLENN